MALSKKHYEQFAAHILSTVEDVRAAAQFGDIPTETAITVRCYMDKLAQRFANDFALANPNFDRERFLRACGF